MYVPGYPADEWQRIALRRLAEWVGRLEPGASPQRVDLSDMPGIEGPDSPHFAGLLATLIAMVEDIYKSSQRKLTLRPPNERLLRHWPTELGTVRLVVCRAHELQTPLMLLNLRQLAVYGGRLMPPPTDDQMAEEEQKERRFRQVDDGRAFVQPYLATLLATVQAAPLPDDHEKQSDIAAHLAAATHAAASNPAAMLLYVFAAWALLDEDTRPNLNPAPPA